MRLAAGFGVPIRTLFDYDSPHDTVPSARKDAPVGSAEAERKKLGARLLQIRKELRVTQLAIDTTINIGRNKISEYESGKKNISFQTLVKFMIALEVQLVDLFDYNDADSC